MKSVLIDQSNVVVEIRNQGDTFPVAPSLSWHDCSDDNVKSGWIFDGININAPVISLAYAKNAKIQETIVLMNEKIAAGRFHGGKYFQIRAEDRENLIGVAVQLARGKTSPHAGKWRALDNAEVVMDDTALGALLDSVFSYLRDLRRQFTVHKEAIRALTTVNDVNAYDITTGWPANT